MVSHSISSKSMSSAPVGLGGPAIAGGKRDPVLVRRGGDEGIVSGAADDAERRQPGMKPKHALT